MINAGAFPSGENKHHSLELQMETKVKRQWLLTMLILQFIESEYKWLIYDYSNLFLALESSAIISNMMDKFLILKDFTAGLSEWIFWPYRPDPF